MDKNSIDTLYQKYKQLNFFILYDTIQIIEKR